MKAPSFQWYLKKYVAALSGSDTTSIKKLAHLAATSTPRLAEPLYLLTLSKGNANQLKRTVEGTWLEKEYAPLPADMRSQELEDALSKEDDRFPVRYQKVFETYIAEANRTNRDREVSLRMREAILETAQQKGLTKYRICKDLQLNPGNVNAFLKNADATKVSRKTARRIWDYVSEQ